MTPRSSLGVALAAAALVGRAPPALAAHPAAPPPLAAKAVDDAAFTPLPEEPTGRAEPEVVKAEVLLDRARFSPGAIDGIDGENFRHALEAYQLQMSLPASGRLDQATWDRLTAGAPAPLKSVEVTKEEADGPFTRVIPAKFEAQSKLPHMGYRDIREELGERYHMSPTLLAALNPGSRFAAGQRITVADVTEAKPNVKVARIVVDKAGPDVEALAADGRLIAFYPASIGSEEKPAPTGDFTVHRVDRDPVYTYDPKYHFKGVSAKEPFSIQPGPNNPVGLVWMDLGGDGYGIHGTPDPEAVGKTQSHGCIRMTNWDALNLAAMVDKGTPVSFGDVQGSTGPVPPPPAEPAPVPSASAASAPAAGTPPGQPSASADAPKP
ncbi:L,D-transpeptidase family protein [Lichenibacterium dinghuense]|uniref:L,D-transpeptidase family protein n=1 Tax=Lichenibacterium dinghuense TaxID=2895977 RepID=UPI001F1A11C1|nr:L,D-transpeptidase [Lichenibacterium sp. 6Y81]